MNLNNVDYNKLAILVKVVEAGNYRRASEVLNVTPSALSQSISALEHSLGIPLFHRIGRRLVLTEAGDRIQREFRAHHEAFTRSLEGLTSAGREVSGLIRIGAYLEFAKLRLAPRIAAFQKRHPDVQIKLVFDTPTRLHRLLVAQKLDLCFSIFPERESPLVLSRPIYEEELVLVAPKGSLSEKPTFAEVMSQPMVEYYLNHQPIRRWLFRHYRKKPRQLPIRTFASTAEMVLALVQRGLGIGVLPEYLVARASGVQICRPTSRHLLDHVWMLRLKGRAPSVAIDAFATDMVEESET